jgi:hypothetical protein
VSGHLRVDAEMAVVVHSRRWHRGGDVVEQVRWRQDVQATSSLAQIGVVVAQALIIEFAWPFLRERWRGVITQQALTSGAVGGLDAHQGIDGKVAAAFPLAIARASSSCSDLRRTKRRNSCRRTLCCTVATVASGTNEKRQILNEDRTLERTQLLVHAVRGTVQRRSL